MNESLNLRKVKKKENIDRLSQLYELGVIDKEDRLVQNDMK